MTSCNVVRCRNVSSVGLNAEYICVCLLTREVEDIMRDLGDACLSLSLSLATSEKERPSLSRHLRKVDFLLKGHYLPPILVPPLGSLAAMRGSAADRMWHEVMSLC